eukprot:TRINITY_DN77972_c0_g1_i1.p1 TRINITY_DN77972_c0_g1~~TRINITY_DN77972_c0_g1_i1.p1  ORF type:complete len:157 (-),score=23.35 TRINITY_DN77972_c0_g1_i1:178-648(-)
MREACEPFLLDPSLAGTQSTGCRVGFQPPPSPSDPPNVRSKNDFSGKARKEKPKFSDLQSVCEDEEIAGFAQLSTESVHSGSQSSLPSIASAPKFVSATKMARMRRRRRQYAYNTKVTSKFSGLLDEWLASTHETNREDQHCDPVIEKKSLTKLSL